MTKTNGAPLNGQKSLFSFFSKKVLPPPKADAKSKLATEDSPSSTFSDPGIKSIHPPIRAGKCLSPLNKLLSKITIGTKLAVFWPDDKKFYPCIVKSRRGIEGHVYLIQYEDGEQETVDLATEKFRLIGGVKRASNTSESPNVSSTKTTIESMKKKRRILEDSEEDMESEDSAEEADSASAFKEDDESIEESLGLMDEDSENEFSEDLSDAEHSPKARKKKANQQFPKVTIVTDNSDSNSARFVSPTPIKSSRFSNLTHDTMNLSKFSCTSPEIIRSSTNDKTSDCSLNSSRPSIIARTIEISPPKPIPGVVNHAGSHLHNHLLFFTCQRCDAHKNPVDHPNYSPRTLSVDFNELERKCKEYGGKLSPASRQWWEIKAQYADTVLLFKTGKFYEMFHDDADVGVSVLNHCYMKGTVAHSGFPEATYDKVLGKLVQAGYKVARVEQTETPEMLKERNKTKSGKKDQVLVREVCSVVSKGTRTFCYLEDASCLENNTEGETIGPLLVIKEVVFNENASSCNGGGDDSSETKAVCEYGVTIVDAVKCVLSLGQFADDVLRSRMQTLLAAFNPSEIIYEGGENGASKTLLSLLKSVCPPSTIIEGINPKERYPMSTAVNPEVRRMLDRSKHDIHPWDGDEAIEELHRKAYYPRSSRSHDPSAVDARSGKGIGRWPEVLRACIQGGASLALSSFGAALFYLQRSLIDVEILSMGIIKAYIPPNNGLALSVRSDGEQHSKNVQNQLINLYERDARNDEGVDILKIDTSESVSAVAEASIDHMALDGTTLSNLEILHNMASRSYHGSLLSKIDTTQSPHGSRLLRAWLLRPLFRKEDIDRRADVVAELSGGSAAVAMSEVRPLLKGTGDIERLLSRIHSMGGAGQNREGSLLCHPDERAILYEVEKHTKRKVGDFSKVLNGLKAASKIPEVFDHVRIQSPLLTKIVRTTDNGGCFPSDLKEKLDFFFENFDLKKAANGDFEPSRGMSEDYDEACDAILELQQEFEVYKDHMTSSIGHGARSSWKYINVREDSKDKYLIELPVSIPVPSEFQVKGKRGKGHNQVNKYTTPKVEALVNELERAIDAKNHGKALGMKLVFAKFDSQRSLWMAASHATAMLDALGSLAVLAAQPGYCRPRVVECHPNMKPGIKVLQGRHPCVAVTHSGGDFIPNDLILGGNLEECDHGDEDAYDDASMLLLSGPNMGGKSTLLRQTCIITILAQMGSYVPAEECILTPVDRIFTRLGASDRILCGQSTFFVELAETAAAVRGATRRSLVIMDELGRGTSTFDGTAIASATVKHLVQKSQCLTLFATHYHSLLEDWKNKSYVRLGHMECVVEEVTDDDSEQTKNITFLYTLGKGPCPKSFGVNVARLAGLPGDVLQKAKSVSDAFEKEMNGESKLHKIIPLKSMSLMNDFEALVKSDGITNLEKLQQLWDGLQ